MQTVTAGLDVSARELVVLARRGQTLLPLATFDNTAAGHLKLCAFLGARNSCARVCLEATGLYGLSAALAMRQRGIRVMVANPRAVSDFAKALLQRSKTDALDAAVMLEFVERMPFVDWQPPSPDRLELRALVRRISALKKALTQERNRLHATSYVIELTNLVRHDIEINIRHLRRRVGLLEEKAYDLVRANPELLGAYRRLTSVRGIARTSALRILAELVTLPAEMSPRQWVAHAGLDPKHFDSGSSVHKPARVSKAGNAYLRAALFMPALVAVRREPRVQAYYERLLARGKKPLQAIVAVMRKLLHAIHGMLAHDADFDGEKFFASPG